MKVGVGGDGWRSTARQASQASWLHACQLCSLVGSKGTGELHAVHGKQTEHA